jgi:hypothetical protein
MGESKDVRRIRRGCTNKAMRKLLLEAIGTGARYRMTKSGVMFLGERGAGITTHLTCSDHRAVENFRTSLRSIGITIERK